MFSGEVSESASSSSTTYYGSCLNMNPDVAERIASLLSSLRLTSLRNSIPQDGEGERLKKIHRQLEWLVSEEPDDRRRRRLRHILPAANCVREQVFALRRYMHNVNTASSTNYATHTHGALTAIMKESFEEEYRKLATVVGVLDAVAELLIFEIGAFDIDCPVESRTIRKLIASTLTNLTFGNAQSKRRLCSHPNLIEYVIRIIDNSHGLAQVYAGLLRNLSWMADAQMSATLAPSVPALVRASLRAYRIAELKCLCATLSALWNLASHSRDNKKALCEEPGFLELLIDLSTNDAEHTTLVEPATGVLKYASMYLAVMGADQYLSPSAIHTLMLRLIDLLNSPSFTVIGNALGILSQLLAKGHQLRSHIVSNHKAMLLLNHLRNSTREDIRNPVKNVLNYLNSFNVSGVYVPASPHPSVPDTPQLSHRFDGMSSSYDGTPSFAPSYVDASRLLKYRSSHSYAASVLTSNMNSTLNAEHFPYSSPLCASTAQKGFAPRPGDRSHHQQQFASLPRQFFQKSEISDTPLPIEGDSNIYLKQMQSATRFSPIATVKDIDMKDISAATTSNCAIEKPQDPNLRSRGSGGGDELRVLSRSDDPSFEVEDSVRCTRCTSTQSLSSLFPGERSTWNSCNNSAAESNRLSPVSTTEIPDSPTQCAPALSSQNFDRTSSSGGNETRDEMSTSKEVPVEISKSNAVKSVNGENSSLSKNNRNTKDSSEQESSVDDDYGSFIGRADSELLNQSIESAMPKRVEINEEFLADMIEQAQPKPSPLKQQGGSGVRNFSAAKALSMKTDNEDFLLQSIASILPQSSNLTHDMSGIGSPPKKARAMTGDTAHTSGGPKRASHAVLSNSRTLTHNCCVSRSKEPMLNGLNMKTKFGNKVVTSNSETRIGAMQRSSLVENQKATEKAQDVSLLLHQDTNEERDTLSEDSYGSLTDNNLIIDKNIPEDIDDEFQTEQLVIDCSILSETVKQNDVKSVQKESHLQVNTLDRFELAQKNDEEQLSRQEFFSLPAPLSNCSSPNNSSCNPMITSTPTIKTSRNNAPISKSIEEKVSVSTTAGSRTLNPGIVAEKSSENCKDWVHARSLPRPKRFVLPKAKPIPSSCTSSNSKISIPRPAMRRNRVVFSKTSHNYASSTNETMKPHAIQKLTKNRSHRILSLHHGNVNDKASTVAVVPENDNRKDAVVANVNDSGTRCDNQLGSERKKTIKQMLITTV